MDDHSTEAPTSSSYSTKTPAAQQQPTFTQHLNSWQPNNVPQLVVGPTHTRATCPHCKANIKTDIEFCVTTRTHRLAMSCCFFCCCCLPYCMNTARNTDHYCPNCHFCLGTYER